MWPKKTFAVNNDFREMSEEESCKRSQRSPLFLAKKLLCERDVKICRLFAISHLITNIKEKQDESDAGSDLASVNFVHFSHFWLTLS